MVSYVLEDTELQQRIKSALRVLAVGDTWLTPAEAAARARISKSHFLRRVRAANGPKHSGEGRLMRFRVSDVDAWISAGFHTAECGQGGLAPSAGTDRRANESPDRVARQPT